MSQSLQIAIIPVTPFQQNCSLLWCTETKKAAVVDPGGDLDTIDAAIAEQGVTLEKILITHGHIDHAGSAGAFAECHGVPIEGPHKDDTFWIDQAKESGATYGLPEAAPFTPDRWLVDGDTVTVGNLTMQVLHCPGHTPGHVVFYEPTTNVAVVGDVLFQGSIGRTDFPRGNHADLINAITTKLWPLGDDVTFVPGHGPTSTFGAERQSNPFVGDTVLAGEAD
jgi:glyoxylase-like metal-dependent hydrolase (beta-lactamase superfamily II)